MVISCSFQPDTGIPTKFLNGLGVGIVLSEPDSGVIHFVNGRGSKLLGYTAEELFALKLSFLDLTHPDDRERSAAEHRRLLAGEIDQYCLDRRYLRKGGEVVWAHLIVTLMLDASGVLRWRAAVLEEMTSTQILQQQLANAEKLAKIVTWSWAAKSDEAITSGDSAFGASKETICDFKRTLDHVHPDDRRIVESAINRALASGMGYSIEYRVIKSNGEIRHRRGLATCLIDETGEVTHLVGATTDVTDAKLRQSAQQAPKPIRDILTHIEKNWNRPIYLEDLARRYGIGARAIQRHFALLGLMPLTRHVKQLRLRHAHQELSNPKPTTSVTAVALYCGFQNLGHFSRDYRLEFGELPSETFRSARLSSSG